jgi:carboxyl-terminal processing protease
MRIRTWLRRGSIALLCLLVLGAGAFAVLFIPAVYFRSALFLIERNALMRDRVDWPAVRAEAGELMRDARSTRDTYPAIRLVLRRLGDNHSHLTPPEAVRAGRRGSNLTLGLTAVWPERVVALVTPGGPAEAAGIRAGDIVESVEGAAPVNVQRVVLLAGNRDRVRMVLQRPGRAGSFAVELSPRQVPFNQPATARLLEDGLGYIEIPGVLGWPESFDADAVRAIAAVDASPTCGWVVDLRRNTGGNMWPMLHAVRPILGEANPFTYRFGKGPWSQKPVYALRWPDPAIAVLTSRLTVSSGELVTIAFRGPSTTRLFGEATAGLASSNMAIPMVDGARLVITTSRPADRTGRAYEGPIEPDQALAIDWSRIGAEDDPVLQVARAWLRERLECRGRSEPPTPKG